jgi:hypothetical protein
MITAAVPIDGAATVSANLTFSGTINHTSNLGIGSTVPVAPLHTKATAATGNTHLSRTEKFTGGDNHYLDVFVDNTTNMVNFVSTGTNDGGFGFGNAATPNALVLDVTGSATVTGDVSAANFNSTSDARLKSNVVTADGSKVCDMRGVNYVKDDVPGAGVIAQELVEIAPELVVSDQRGYLSVRYDGLTAYLIEAVKDLQKQIDELKAK